MQNIQNLTIDINKKPFQTITANVGEVGSRYIRINIVDKSLPIDLTSVTVSIYAKKPDGNKVFNSVIVEDAKQGIILAELTSQILAVEGLVKLTLLLVKSSSKLCSKQFLLNVDSSIVDDTALESTNEFTALVDALGRVNNIDSRFENVSSQLEQNIKKQDYNQTNYTMSKIHKLIVDSYNESKQVEYFMIGDSIRNANGKHIYNIVSNKLESLSLKCTLRGHSGLSLKHWSGKQIVTPGDETASDLISFITGDGSNTIVDISLGLNDPDISKEYMLECLQTGINTIKSSKPNVTFILTSPHKHGDINAQMQHRENIKWCYETIIKNNSGNIAYIDVFNNVFPIYTSEIGYQYMSDLLHPNEVGQRKIAEFIISKLIPNYLVDKTSLLKGYFDKSTSEYDKIKDCKFRVELKITEGDTPKQIFLKYYKTFDSWYLCTDGNSLNNISDAIQISDGEFKISNIEGALYNDKLIKFECKLSIKNSSVLSQIKDEFKIEIKDSIVNNFSAYKTIDEQLNILNSKSMDYSFRAYVGYIDINDVNYSKVDNVGFKINFYQTKGTKLSNLKLQYISSWKAWYLYSNNALISNPIQIENGEQIVTGDDASVDGNIVSFKAQIEIYDKTQLLNIDSDISFEIKNFYVKELINENSIIEHITNLYRLIAN